MSGFPHSDPWDPIRELQREMGRLMESFAPWQGWRLPRHFPALNLYDASDRYLVTVEVPGLTADQIDISITSGMLTLRGARVPPDSVGDDQYRRQERPFGTWSRTLGLPTRIDADRVTATLALGILSIELPKAEETRPRQIQVQTLLS
jgi:HSP20 family protein